VGIDLSLLLLQVEDAVWKGAHRSQPGQKFEASRLGASKRSKEGHREKSLSVMPMFPTEMTLLSSSFAKIRGV